MDPVTLVPAVLVLSVLTPVVRRVRHTRAAERGTLRYLEALLVEARSRSYPVVGRRI